MSTASQDLAEGLAALDSELGETFVASGVKFTARREEREKTMGDYAGITRETVLHVRRAVLPSTLPVVGTLINKPGEVASRLARIEPGRLAGWLILVLADEVS